MPPDRDAPDRDAPDRDAPDRDVRDRGVPDRGLVERSTGAASADPGPTESTADRGTSAPRTAEPATVVPAAEPASVVPAAEPAVVPAAGPPGSERPDVRAATTADVGDGGRRRSRRRASALIGTLTLLLGFAIAVQFHSTSSGDALAGARPDDLISILDDQNRESARLRARIADLQGTLQRLQDAGTTGPAARAEAQGQADGLGILTGTLAATGPGVIVTITDPKNALKAEDLLDVVEELRGAGAEAVQFGPVRVGTTSSFTDGAGHVVLDGAPLGAPYVVRAIGPAATMQTALQIPGGVSAVVRNAGGTATIARASSIVITVLRPASRDRYARPSK